MEQSPAGRSKGDEGRSDKARDAARLKKARPLLLSVAATAGVLAVALRVEFGWIAFAVTSAVGFFAIGVLLWWFGAEERKWDEIGRAIMVSALLAVILGVPQYLISQREKERDFRTSLTLQRDLTGADLHDEPLSRVQLPAKVLSKANLRGVPLDHASLLGSDLTGADLRGAHLRDADLRGARLEGASLDGADLRDAKLKDADLTGASLPAARLQGARLDSAQLGGACMADAVLQGAEFGGADLRGAVLTGSDVKGTSFLGDLRPALLEHSGLAHLKHADEATWPDGSHSQPRMRGLPRARGLRRPARVIPARASNVSDGDTVQMEAEGGTALPNHGRIRLVGVNAPDPDDAGGPAATRYLRAKLKHRRVAVQLGTTPPADGGRSLAYIWLSPNKTANEGLLASGNATFAAIGTAGPAPELRAAELGAKQEGVGLWEHCPRPAERIAPPQVGVRTR